jgi:hypothetical protein
MLPLTPVPGRARRATEACAAAAAAAAAAGLGHRALKLPPRGEGWLGPGVHGGAV